MTKQSDSATFRVGITRDFLRPDGSLGFGEVGLSRLDDAPGLAWEFLSENESELTPAQAAAYDALLVLGPRVTAETLRGEQRLALVARFGVGYDSIDVEACTAAGVALTITPDGVRRPVAVAVLTFLLALSHKLFFKDRLTREGRWAEKLDHMGTGLTGRTLGVIGLGNIGREVFRLAAPLEMRHLAADPLVKPADGPAGITLVNLDTLLGEADFVVICCALNAETRHLLDARRLSLLKPTAFVINVARGPIIDQQSLTAALRERRIAGAGLDVFEDEPIDLRDPLLELENVILTPHALCWTDECFAGIGRSAIGSILDLAAGRIPNSVVNRTVLESPKFQEKLQRYSVRLKEQFDMRENRVKRKLARGETVVGTMFIEFATRGIGRLAAAAGAEFGVFDMEHSGWTIDTIGMLMASTRSSELVPLVRPPAVQYHFIAQALDMGAMGVVVPFIDEPEQAEFVVQCTRYPPAGRRGCAFTIGHDDYLPGEVGQKMRSANDELMVVLQIESTRGLENVEKIAAVKGVDAIWIGQFDLSASMGIPGKVDHPEFQQAQRRILEACQQTGVAAGYGSLFVDDVVKARDQGFRYLCYTADLWIYQRALRDGLQQIRG